MFFPPTPPTPLSSAVPAFSDIQMPHNEQNLQAMLSNCICHSLNIKAVFQQTAGPIAILMHISLSTLPLEVTATNKPNKRGGEVSGVGGRSRGAGCEKSEVTTLPEINTGFPLVLMNFFFQSGRGLRKEQKTS